MRKLMKYVKQYTWQSIICPILMVGEVVLELMLPYYMSYIIDVGIPNGDRKYIIEIGVKMVAMALGSLSAVPPRQGLRLLRVWASAQISAQLCMRASRISHSRISTSSAQLLL